MFAANYGIGVHHGRQRDSVASPTKTMKTRPFTRKV